MAKKKAGRKKGAVSRKELGIRIVPAFIDMVDVVRHDDGSTTYLPKDASVDIQVMIQAVEIEKRTAEELVIGPPLDNRIATVRTMGLSYGRDRLIHIKGNKS